MWSALVILALSLCLIPEVLGAFKLTILHTNDMHARFDEVNQNTGPCKDLVSHKGCYGGFARLKEAVLEARQHAKEENRASLFLNAGDTFQGTPYYSLFKWNVTSDLLNRLDLDVMSLGNHEFDDGVAGLAPFLQRSTVPIVTANIDTDAEESLQSNGAIIHKSLRINFGQNSVCVVGYLTPDTKFMSSTGRVTFRPEIEAIRQEIKRLKEPGKDKCDVIIGLGHSGFEVDKQIAKAIPEIDVIVGGHTDTFLYTGTPPDIEKPEGSYPYIVTQSSGKRVPVVQAYGYTKYLGELMLDWDDNWNLVKMTGNPLLLDSQIVQDAPMAAAVKQWAGIMGEDTSQIIGSTTTRLEGTTGLCACAECNLGNLITDAFVEYYVTSNKQSIPIEFWTDAPISLIQAGCIRATIDGFYSGGNITYGDLLAVMPFKNRLVKTVVTGFELRGILEYSIGALDASCSNRHSKGQFLQVSGIHVTYDILKPKGQRIVDIRIRCSRCLVPKYAPMNETEHYGVVVSDYLYSGGDNFKFNQEAPRKILELTDTEAVAEYLKRKSPVYPEVSGRITILNLKEPSGSGLPMLSVLLFFVSLLLSQCFK